MGVPEALWRLSFRTSLLIVYTRRRLGPQDAMERVERKPLLFRLGAHVRQAFLFGGDRIEHVLVGARERCNTGDRECLRDVVENDSRPAQAP